tara:strand:+ start:744 stop:968 length:225 start_codon:yes stop_codon:yes gene_type:complete
MPQIGWFEILLIVVVSILVIGPKDFPIVLKKIGSWIGSVKKYFSELQNEVSLYENENEDEKAKENKPRVLKDEK